MVAPNSAARATFVQIGDKSWKMLVGPRLVRTFEFTSSGQIDSITLSQFYEDRQGDLWIGTLDQGLYRLQKQSIRTYTKEQGLIDRDAYAIYQDRSGAVWIGAWHSGLSRFADGRFTNFTSGERPAKRTRDGGLRGPEGTLWADSRRTRIFDNGRFRKAAEPILPADAVVQVICQDQQASTVVRNQRGWRDIRMV